MKKTRAVKSASESSLRSAMTSTVSSRSAFPTIKNRRTVDPFKAVSNKTKKNSGGQEDPTFVKSERVTSEGKQEKVTGRQFNAAEKYEGPTNVDSVRVYPNKPKSLEAPKKALPPSSSKPTAKKAAPKREKTRTVFVAQPVVNLNEGPGFGSTTHSISKTKMPVAPKPPKGKKNA